MVGWVAGRGLVGVHIMLVMFEGKVRAGAGAGAEV